MAQSAISDGDREAAVAAQREAGVTPRRRIGTGVAAVCLIPLLLAACSAHKSAVSAKPASPLAGRYTSASLPVDFLPNGVVYYQATGTDPFVADTYTVRANTLTFKGSECHGAVGIYTWMKAAGVLTLSKKTDACQGRINMMDSQLYWAQPQYPFATVARISKSTAQVDYGHAALDAQNNVYQTDGQGAVYKYAPDGTLLKKWDVKVPIPYATGITVTSDGSVYVANFEGSKILKYDAAGHLITSWTANGGWTGALGLAHDSQGNIYVVMHRTQPHYIYKYSPDGTLLASWLSQGNGVTQIGATSTTGPGTIAVDAQGNSVINDPDKNRLVRVTAQGDYAGQITEAGGHPLDAPGAIAIDTHGNVFTISDGVLYRFDRANHATGAWLLPSNLALIADVAVDSSDHIFGVADHIYSLTLPAEKALPAG